MRIIIGDEIGLYPATASYIEAKLEEAKGEDIELVIDTDGGSVLEGFSIFNKLDDYQGKITVVIEKALSMGSYIAMVGDVVKVKHNSSFMIHNPWGITVGDHNDLREQADITEKLANILAEKYAEKTKKSIEDIKKMMDTETYLFGKEIVEEGFADELIDKGQKAKKKDEIMAKLKPKVPKSGKIEYGLVAKYLNPKKKEQKVEKDDKLDIQTIRADAIKKERERISALNAVQIVGIDEKTFQTLKNKAIESGQDEKEFIFALYQASLEQKAVEDAKREAMKQKAVEDAKNLAGFAGQIQTQGGEGEKIDQKKALEAKALEIAQKMQGAK